MTKGLLARVLLLALLSESSATSMWWTKTEKLDTPQVAKTQAVPEDANSDLSLLKLEDAKGRDSEDSLAEAVAYRIGENADNDDFLAAFHH
mmetsp:Transcript_123807/g.174551  ORF Transcript_123807/g.174551 Transcript_123807/m.174551 type:complete len:91 (-) Transcript_123807:98-370(-)|eukprot:symbB.v1.2.025210.t1/scaffold2437.1/size79084/7